MKNVIKRVPFKPAVSILELHQKNQKMIGLPEIIEARESEEFENSLALMKEEVERL